MSIEYFVKQRKESLSKINNHETILSFIGLDADSWIRAYNETNLKNRENVLKLSERYYKLDMERAKELNINVSEYPETLSELVN